VSETAFDLNSDRDPSREPGRKRRDDASLIERAADVYDFAAALRGGPRAVHAYTAPAEVVPETPSVAPVAAAPVAAAPLAPPPSGETVSIDRALLREAGLLIPEAPVGTLAEEFRLVKRQLLLRAGSTPREATPQSRMILVCSAQPNEGKTFCAINLALSLASERDSEVLLVDADVAKPQVFKTLGIEADSGLIDAIAASDGDAERYIRQTDIAKLSVLHAGRATLNDTELLSSARAASVIEALATANPRRIVILDSAPALAASPAGVLAHRVGRVLVVVRADRTSETELREAIALLDGCPDISLLLNASSFFGTNRTYGSYYGSDDR